MIREATPSDMDKLFALAKAMHAESRYSVMEFSVIKFIEFIEIAVSSSNYLVLVVEQDEQIIGGFIGFVCNHVFSSDLMACDLALYMDPDHRGGGAAAKLIKRYLAWAKNKGAKLITAGITTGVNTDTTARLYERLGFRICGALCEFEGQ